MRTLGLWSISACNETAAAITLPRERLVLALPSVRIVSNERARAALAYAQGRTPAARAAGVIRYLLLGGTVAGAAVGSRKEAVAALAGAALLADQVARRLDSEVPGLAPWLAGLEDGPVTFGPGACASRTVFAALVHGAKPIEAVIR
jgi:hypothetical protein